MVSFVDGSDVFNSWENWCLCALSCPLMASLYSVERDGPHKWFRSLLAEFAAALFNQAHSH